MIMFRQTSAEAWNVIKHIFASQSYVHSTQLQAELGKTKNLDLSALV
jgi:hypothetical protein